MAPGSVSGGCKGIRENGRYPVPIDLSAEEARRNLHFDAPKHGDRSPACELIAPLYHSLLLLLAAVAVTTYAAVACRSQVATR